MSTQPDLMPKSMGPEAIKNFRRTIKPTTIEDWKRSDLYHNHFLIPKDDILDSVVTNCTEQGLPEISVSKAQGKYLNLLAKSIGAKKMLEIGTLGG